MWVGYLISVVYYLYKVENDECKLIFRSDEHVYNVKTTSCENFKNGKLNVAFTDTNNDGYPDLNFSGTKEIYCFYPDDRPDDNKILKEERVNIKYLFDKQTGKFVKAKM